MFTVSVEGVIKPATFTGLGTALKALWLALDALRLSKSQAEAFRHYLTGPEAEMHVLETLERDGAIALTFEMAGRSHLVEIVADEAKRFPWGSR